MATSEEQKQTEMVHARLSRAEKDALERLVKRRADALLAQGITGQDTFSAYLRAHIRTESATHGFPVRDPVPVSDEQAEAFLAKARSLKGGKPPRKAK